MSPDQCARLLAIAGTYDSRLTPPSKADAQARAVAWSKALHDTMEPEWAVDAIIAHYAENTTAVMPAHLNHAWRAHRRAEAERAATSIALGPGDGIPMPEHIRAEIDRLLTRRANV